MVGPWKTHFAWLPVQLPYRVAWLEPVQRRSYTVDLGSVLGEPVYQSGYHYRDPDDVNARRWRDACLIALALGAVAMAGGWLASLFG